MLRHDEDALDVAGQAARCSGPRDAGDKGNPGRTDDLRPKQSSDEGDVRVLIGAPPVPEFRSEVVPVLLSGLLAIVVKPQQPGNGRDIVHICLSDPHTVSLALCGPRRPIGVEAISGQLSVEAAEQLLRSIKRVVRELARVLVRVA